MHWYLAQNLILSSGPHNTTLLFVCAGVCVCPRSGRRRPALRASSPLCRGAGAVHLHYPSRRRGHWRRRQQQDVAQQHVVLAQGLDGGVRWRGAASGRIWPASLLAKKRADMAGYGRRGGPHWRLRPPRGRQASQVAAARGRGRGLAGVAVHSSGGRLLVSYYTTQDGGEFLVVDELATASWSGHEVSYSAQYNSTYIHPLFRFCYTLSISKKIKKCCCWLLLMAADLVQTHLPCKL